MSSHWEVPISPLIHFFFVNFASLDHHLLLSWPDWCQPQVQTLPKKSLNFQTCFSRRMYSDGSVTRKGWSINWIAIPDWWTHKLISPNSTFWPIETAPILTRHVSMKDWASFLAFSTEMLFMAYNLICNFTRRQGLTRIGFKREKLIINQQWNALWFFGFICSEIHTGCRDKYLDFYSQ